MAIEIWEIDHWKKILLTIYQKTWAMGVIPSGINHYINGSYPIFGLYLQHDDPRMAGRLPFSNLCFQDQTVSLSPPDLMGHQVCNNQHSINPLVI